MANGVFTTTDIDLEFFGSAVSNDDLFVLTNEFSDYSGVGGHTPNIVGGAGVQIEF